MKLIEWFDLESYKKDMIVAKEIMGLNVRGVGYKRTDYEGGWFIYPDFGELVGVHTIFDLNDILTPHQYKEYLNSEEILQYYDNGIKPAWAIKDEIESIKEMEDDFALWGCNRHYLEPIPEYTTSWKYVGDLLNRLHTVPFIPGFVGQPKLHFLCECSLGLWEAQLCHDFGYSEPIRCESGPEAICLTTLSALKYFGGT